MKPLTRRQIRIFELLQQRRYVPGQQISIDGILPLDNSMSIDRFKRNVGLRETITSLWHRGYVELLSGDVFRLNRYPTGFESRTAA